MKAPVTHGRGMWGKPRAGVVYLLVAIALFVLFPLLALVVHTGLTTLTRRQMQTAVDTAALEALRHRDDATDGFVEAQSTVQVQFDDNFDPGDGDPFNLGAGPIVEFNGGTTLGGSSFQASATISLPGPPVWKPVPERNETNQVAGDMVAGNYDETATDHSEGPGYVRSDFSPVADRDADPYDSVLVRLRRSDEPVTTGVSVGPPVPFLFGRGVPGGANGTALLDRRQRGTIVRAAAIADARPAAVVGPVVTGASNVQYGLTNFWVEHDSWINASSSVVVEYDTNGAFVAGLDGEFVTDEDAARTVVLGAALDARGEDAPRFAENRFVPLYATIPSTNLRRVVGFGLANVEPSSNPMEMTIVIQSDTIVRVNASSTFVRSPFADDVTVPVKPTITRAEFATVMSEWLNLHGDPHVVNAPSSVRSLD